MTVEHVRYPEDAAMLLAELPTWDADRFATEKRRYSASLVEPTKALVAALGDRLVAEVSPGLHAVPRTNGSIAPITNDRRFAPDKPPYKDHLLLRFWEGDPKKTAPTLFVRIGAAGLGFASGAALADRAAWQAAVADETTGATLVAALDGLAHHPISIAGDQLAKVPGGLGPDHPRQDLLRRKGFQVRWAEGDAGTLSEPLLVDRCLDRLVELGPVHRWLVAAGV